MPENQVLKPLDNNLDMNMINQNESHMNLEQIEPELTETVGDVEQDDDKELIDELKRSFSLTEEL